MKKMLFILLYLFFISPVFADGNKAIEVALQEYIQEKDARIGVAVIINGKDTVSVNGKRDFPMMSVMKFPLALTVAHWVDANGMSMNDTVTFSENALKEDTYSPMLKKYGKSRNSMTVRELLEWSLVESDNNASDILLNRIGGISGATQIMRKIGVPDDIEIGASEDDMHREPYLSYLNRTTPLAMAQLFDRFDTEMRNTLLLYSEIANMVEQCRTGIDRLVAPLSSSNTTIGHKTGTGFPTSDGRISAINDCGYVNLPNGERYSIAVFVADSGYDMAETSAIIAEISRIVWIRLTEQKKD
ncbi:class A beta-lactamase [Bacteroides caecimuris]|jgi:beta-lactamase class A|uniref:class A beta-lactamase n=3 Tax=Bacteroides caecimuris TaxID=1796613 RepID=UPI0025970B86|nr:MULTISPECIES: class A beta-lactamase [Bacteroides]